MSDIYFIHLALINNFYKDKANAISIFENSLPVSNLDYPLGYPILQSISYKIIGTYEIEFFSQALQIIYPLFSIFALLRILVITKNNLFKYVLLFSLLNYS